MLLETVSWILP